MVTRESGIGRGPAPRESEASHLRLQALFDHALDAIMLADDRGRYLEVNPAVCQLTGYSRDELLGMGPADLASTEPQRGEVADRFDTFVRSRTEAGTFALRHKDGHVVETEYRAVSNIQPGVHLSVLRDVTAHNRMVRALTLAETEFRELAENAADIVTKLRVDGDGRLQVDYVNPAATTILGYPQQRLRQDPELLLELFRHRSAPLEDTLALLPTPAMPTRQHTVQVSCADGRLVWLEINATLIDPATTPATIQVVARDVTARSEMTQALELALEGQLEAAAKLRTLDAMKDTFLQSISHELRTPLTSILGFAHLLIDPRQEVSPEDATEFHRHILVNAERLQTLLDDLLDLDSFARRHIEPDRLPTDLPELIQRMLDDLDLGAHRVELDLGPVTMDIDAAGAKRSLAHLLHNIVRHTPPATRVWIRTRATPEGLELTVDDDGPGIPESDRVRIIGHFEQGVEAASSAQPGTGIGLSLVNTFAQIHGGELTITDAPGGGTRVVVTLAHDGTGVPALGGHPASPAAPFPGVADLHAQDPDPVGDAPADATGITSEALRQLLQARTVDQVRGIVLSVVHRLGGWTVPARLADGAALPVDLSFGIGDPLLPAAEADSATRRSLERHLPRIVEDARRTLENLARTEQLAHDASIDPLTGLLNRRAYERVLPRLRAGDTVVLFDLDAFKPLNDTRGHQAGDQVLRSFGVTLRNFTRATDHPCRIGGDEFALLLEGTSAAQADRLTDRLRSHWDQQRPWPVGFSVGIATVDADAAEAVASADGSMYRAKRSSRGRTLTPRGGTGEDERS